MFFDNADAAQVKIEDQQQQHNSSDDVNTELATNPELNKILMNEEDLKTSYMVCHLDI